MRITFLGTSSGAPTRARNVTAMALQLPQRGTWWLFDCGEGTQQQILRSPLKMSQLEKVFLTHLHGDHLFGLPGLLASRSMQNGGTTPVTVYGPRGIEDYLRTVMQVSQTHLGYPLAVETIRPGAVCEDAQFSVLCGPVLHGIEAFGYTVVEKDQPGHFDAAKAQAMGIPPGPLYGRLKNGETVTLPDGRTVDGTKLTGPTIRGRKVVFAGDTTFTPRTVELARDADVLVHEATYLEEDRALAVRARHSTAVMAAEVAQQANVRALLLTHFSARYEAEPANRLHDLLNEAQAIFPNTYLARDFWHFEVERAVGH